MCGSIYLRVFNLYKMKEIKLTLGYVAYVDDEDFERINQYKWSVKIGKTNVYAKRNIIINGIWKAQTMHAEIIGHKWSDHVDHNGLNNQKYNLRPCTNQQNGMNRRKLKNKTSKFKGVSFDSARDKWRSGIHISGKSIFLGRFIEEIEAAKLYNKKAIELFGEFAHLNVL